MAATSLIEEGLRIDYLVPAEANQEWKLELFEVSASIEPHYHKLQRQFLLGAEGNLCVQCEGAEPVVLGGGELVRIEPGIAHALHPEGTAHFFSLTLPGFVYPDDVYHGTPEPIQPWHSPDVAGVLDPKYFGERLDQGDYGVYNIASSTGWSVALLEINDSPRHLHKIETEIFFVVSGALDIEINGHHQTVSIGESVTIKPGNPHQLKSATAHPVRLLCFNFPAFDPSNMLLVDD